jgi:DNA invertase Pin-like site-specific DNA recombinase
MKRAALYIRVSTLDQHPETQLHELRQFASQREFEIVDEYTDHGISGTKARRPALDRLLQDAHRHRFDVVLVWSCDRLARSTKHFLQVLDELNDLGIQFLSQREAIDTDGPLGRAIVVIVSAVAELERSLIVERVRAGMRRAKLDGRRIGRAPLDVDRGAIVSDRRNRSQPHSCGQETWSVPRHRLPVGQRIQHRHSFEGRAINCGVDLEVAYESPR